MIRSKLYCHTISSNIVVHKCPAISLPYIMEIPLNNPQTINIRGVSQPYTVRVTAMQANHCPGSVMFLFEKLKAGGEVDIRILYTGDFRFEGDSFLSCTESLHAANKPLVVDEMYLDTTFLSEDYPTFPPRREAELRVWQLTRDWVGRNRSGQAKFVVLLHLPARFVVFNVINIV